jgi:hypothetical protein
LIRAAFAGLFAAGAVFAGVIQWELSSSPDPVPTPTVGSRPSGSTAASLPREADQVRTWVATVLDRPLFSPDRRPPAQSGQEMAAPAGLPRLTGIMVGPFGRSAIFATDPKPAVIPEGGRIGAYTVKSIDPAQVQVAGPDGLRTVRPSFQPTPAKPVLPEPPRRPGMPVSNK